MANDATKRFVELLEEDAALAKKRAENWAKLAEHEARLEDLEGNTIATAEQMVECFRSEEKRLRDMIAACEK